MFSHLQKSNAFTSFDNNNYIVSLFQKIHNNFTVFFTLQSQVKGMILLPI